MLGLLHPGNGRLGPLLGHQRGRMVQPTLRAGDREVGEKGAHRSPARGGVIVLLIPARTDTSYFHDFIYHQAEIRFIRGRLRFTDETGAPRGPAPFPSMLVIYNPPTK